MPPPPSPTNDTLFWTRMNSPSSHHDLPEYTLPTPDLALRLLISTPAGKPLLHLQYPQTAPAPQSLGPIAAAATAFQHLTLFNPREIRTPHGVLLSYVHHPFHLHLSSPTPSTSFIFLRSIARLAISTIYFLLSADFPRFITANPNSHVAHLLVPTQALLQQAIYEALAHPLSHLLLAPVSLPCPTSPSSRRAINEVLRNALVRWRNVVTHALIFTAIPPYPRRLIATAATEHCELSPMDILLLFNLAPLRADESPRLPQRVYLQANEFSSASSVVMRPVQLRLDPDDFEQFKSAVGGAHWRPEWNASGGGVVWIMGLVRKSAAATEAVGNKFLDFVEDGLDRKSATRDLLVSMERPWRLEDMSLAITRKVKDAVRAVIVIGNERISGTVGSFTHDLGIAVMETLVRWDQEDMSVRSPLVSRTNSSIVARFPEQSIFVVMWFRKYVVCFSDSADERQSLVATEKSFVPWMKRFSSSIVPEHDTAVIPSEMLLPKFLSALVL